MSTRAFTFLNSLTSQFKAQEPGTDAEVLQFCQLNYGVTFPIAKKAGPFSGPADERC